MNKEKLSNELIEFLETHGVDLDISRIEEIDGDRVAVSFSFKEATITITEYTPESVKNTFYSFLIMKSLSMPIFLHPLPDFKELKLAFETILDCETGVVDNE